MGPPGAALPMFGRASTHDTRPRPAEAARALALVDGLTAEGALLDYPYFHATRGTLLGRLGRTAEAADAFREALARTSDHGQQRFLARRIAESGFGVGEKPPT